MERRKLIVSLFFTCCFILFLCSGKDVQAETIGEDSLYLYQKETKSLIIKGKGEDIAQEIASGYELVAYQYGSGVSRGTGMKSITIGDGITALPRGFLHEDWYHILNNDCLETVVFGKSLQTIEDNVLTYCTALKNIEVTPENPYFKVEEKGLYSKDGKKLYAYPLAAEGEPVILPGTEEFAPAVFAYSHMTRIEIPASVKTLSKRLFTHCEQLEELTFAENSQCVRTELSYVNNIDGPDDAIFSYCPRLTEVRFGENFKRLAVDTFHNSSVRSVYFGKSFRGVTGRNGKASKVFGWSYENTYSAFLAIQKIEVSRQNPYFKVKKGALLSKNGKKLYAYPAGRKNISYTVPDSVEIIAAKAFYDQKYLKKVHTGKNTKVIGRDAFGECTKLKKVFLGKKIKTLKVGAFSECDELTTIVNLEKVKKIGEGALGYTKIIYMSNWSAGRPRFARFTQGEVISFYMAADSKRTTWSVIKGKKRVKILKRAKNSAWIKVKFKKKGYVVIQARQGNKKKEYDFNINRKI